MNKENFEGGRRPAVGRAKGPYHEDELSQFARRSRDERVGSLVRELPSQKAKSQKWSGTRSLRDRWMFEIYLTLSDHRTEASVQLPSMGGPQTMSSDELSELIRLLAELRAGMSLVHEAIRRRRIETIGTLESPASGSS